MARTTVEQQLAKVREQRQALEQREKELLAKTNFGAASGPTMCRKPYGWAATNACDRRNVGALH